MLARDFCYWLQGAIELGKIRAPLKADQIEMIRKHLSMVPPFKKTIEDLTKAEGLVQVIKTLDQTNAYWGAVNIWNNICQQLHDVFKHQLDAEVSFAPDHLHEPVRC